MEMHAQNSCYDSRIGSELCFHHASHYLLGIWARLVIKPEFEAVAPAIARSSPSHHESCVLTKNSRDQQIYLEHPPD
jgi:hypothetical protein